MCKGVFFLLVLVCSLTVFGQPDATEGSLYAIGKSGRALGACPLKETEVQVDISGFISRVNVRQEFVNSFSQPIEAVYRFPLEDKGAVDRMTMTVGDRVIRGGIMKKAEAAETYEAAKNEGKTASLLDQEQPGVFKQSVANIMPGEKVVIEISYVETLKYEDGAYEFVFPMVVARQSPRATTKVRNGSNISVEVNLNAGVPIEQIRSASHQIEQINYTPNTAKVTLREGKTIPNRDFVLKYDVTGKRIEDAVLTHRDARGGFFTLILQPPDVPEPEDRTPKEIVFVLDTSGSMDGFPIEKAKEAMRLSLDGLYPDDTFNLITFAGDTEILFDRPVPATRSNLDRAKAFIANRNGDGGTEMMKAVRASLEPSDSQEHLRIVCFMTDGVVGNDDEIVAEVKRHPRARVFSFGIGESVNHSLLDRIAQEGKGEATYVGLKDDGSKAARKFYERVRTPLLTDLVIDWNGMPVTDVYPTKLTDLFSAKPISVSGRYTQPAKGTIKLRGFVAGQPYQREIELNLPDKSDENDSLASLWARTQISEVLKLRESNSGSTDDLDKRITDLGLEYGILTEFTSFVAVEERIVNQNGRPVTINVPLAEAEKREGADDETVSVAANQIVVASATQGAKASKGKGRRQASRKGSLTSYSSGTGSGGGFGSGSGNGSGSGLGGGSGSGSADASPPPPIAASVTIAQPAAAVDAVEVTGGMASMVDITSASIGNTFTARQIQSLPVNGRSFSSLLTLSPRARQGALDAGDHKNTFTIDGAEIQNPDDGIKKDIGDGSVILAVKPERIPVARTQDVLVDIEVDIFGFVTTARVREGAGRLRTASASAAKLMRFAPAVASDGRPVRIVGTVLYRFGKAGKVECELRDMKAAAPTDAELRVARLNEKLHFWLSDLIERSRLGNSTAGENESKFVARGKAFVKVSLKDRTPGAVAKLRAAGLDISRQPGKQYVEGRIAVGRIVDVAGLDEVILVVPRI